MLEKLKRLAFALMCKRFRRATLEDVQGAWYTCNAALAWAYGGGGRRYGNAAEDIDRSIAGGFKVIELDFARSADGIPLASHFFRPEDSDVEWDHIPTVAEFKTKPVNGRYTPLTFRDVIDRYGDKDVFFSLDPFYYYCKVKNGEKEFREYVARNTTQQERKKLILQIYSFKSLCEMVDDERFGALHYVIGVGNWWKVKHIIPLLTKAGVRSVSFQDCDFTAEMMDGIKLLHDAGIIVSAAGVDDMERYRTDKALGVDCVNTTYLKPKEMAS